MSVEAKTVKEILVDAELKALIPPLSSDERAGLEADILRDGCIDAIKIWHTEDGDVIIDGHNRFDICEKHGIPYGVEAVPGITDRESAKRWMIAHQFHRRNLNEAQRAMLAGVLANIKLGDNQYSEMFMPHEAVPSLTDDSALSDSENEGAQICAPSQSAVAELFNVSRRSVQHARKVQQNGIPELAQMVIAGEVSVSAAAEVTTLPEDEQRKIVIAGADAVTDAAREIRSRDKSINPEILQQDSQPSIPEKVEAAESVTVQPSIPVESDISASIQENILLPCAHCGGEANFAQDFDLRYGPSYCLICGNSECRMQTPLCRSQEEARTIWNTRQSSNLE